MQRAIVLTRPDGQPFRISPTRIQDAEQCMHRFKILYIDGLREEDEEPNKFLAFGTAMHRVMEWAHAGDNPPTREELIGMLDVFWIDHQTLIQARQSGKPVWQVLGFDSAEEEESFKKEGRSILDDYYVAQIQDNYRKAWMLEAYHTIPLEIGYTMSLKIDRIDKLEDGRYRVIDYKTSKNLEKPEDLNEDLQVILYAWALHKLYGVDYDQIESCGKYFLRHNRYVTTSVPIDQFMVGAALERVERKIRQAEEGDFSPSIGWWCKWCQAKQVCQYVPPWAA